MSYMNDDCDPFGVPYGTSSNNCCKKEDKGSIICISITLGCFKLLEKWDKECKVMWND